MSDTVQVPNDEYAIMVHKAEAYDDLMKIYERAEDLLGNCLLKRMDLLEKMTLLLQDNRELRDLANGVVSAYMEDTGAKDAKDLEVAIQSLMLYMMR